MLVAKNGSTRNNSFVIVTQLVTFFSDDGLTLETSSAKYLYGGQFTLTTQFIKPNYLVILPPTQHHSFFRNLPPLFYTTVCLDFLK